MVVDVTVVGVVKVVGVVDFVVDVVVVVVVVVVVDVVVVGCCCVGVLAKGAERDDLIDIKRAPTCPSKSGIVS